MKKTITALFIMISLGALSQPTINQITGIATTAAQPYSLTFSKQVTFTRNSSFMVKRVDDTLTFFHNLVGACLGCKTTLFLEADGSHEPVFSGFYKLPSSGNYDTANGQRQMVEMIYTADSDFVYSIRSTRKRTIVPPSGFVQVIPNGEYASSSNSAHPITDGFDNNYSTYWQPDGFGDHYAGVAFDVAPIITKISVTIPFGYPSLESGKYLQGSNDGVNWTNLFTIPDGSLAGQDNEYTFTNSTAYTYYAIFSPGGAFAFAEFKLYKAN